MMASTEQGSTANATPALVTHTLIASPLSFLGCNFCPVMVIDGCIGFFLRLQQMNIHVVASKNLRLLCMAWKPESPSQFHLAKVGTMVRARAGPQGDISREPFPGLFICASAFCQTQPPPPPPLQTQLGTSSHLSAVSESFSVSEFPSTSLLVGCLWLHEGVPG